MDIVQQHENCEVMIMTSRLLNVLDPERRRDAYFQIGEHLDPARHACTQLEPAFVPWATPHEPRAVDQLAQHPKFVVRASVSARRTSRTSYRAAACART